MHEPQLIGHPSTVMSYLDGGELHYRANPLWYHEQVVTSFWWIDGHLCLLSLGPGEKMVKEFVSLQRTGQKHL